MAESFGRITRRRFVAAAAGTIALPGLVPAGAIGLGGAAAPGERIGMGFIGVGRRGMDHVRGFASAPDVQILAVCDPHASKRDAAKKYVDGRYAAAGRAGAVCAAYNDFRDLLAHQGLDAVVIASPEHWHALHAIAAVTAGKDVYSEKALTLTIAEGRALCDAVRRHERIFQVGTQQRSDAKFRFACELARSGRLGELRRVLVGVPGGYTLPNAGSEPVPPGLDYDLWLGPSPSRPYNAVRISSPNGWYHIYDHCVGFLQSWGIHHVDIALWGAPALAAGRVKVEGTAAFPEDGLGNTPLAWRVEVTDARGLVLSFTDNAQNAQGCRFEGDEGWVHVNRGGISADPASLLAARIQSDEVLLYRSDDHHRNFLDGVRTRRDPVSPVESGHLGTTVTNIADIAIRLGRELEWDWDAEAFAGDDDANRLRTRPMRSPWSMG
ncbi:MAG: Gfo/Idh/MocA family oxidoreductase [Planctomycetes bacterium]|nr:Gfo/Idh/MocA family oxidoreductase [Planctomycetota bacterium]